MGIGVTDAVLLGALVLAAVLFKQGCLTVEALGLTLVAGTMIFKLKGAFWTIMVFVLYFCIVQDHCTGGIHTYFIIMMVLISIGTCYLWCCNQNQANQRQMI